MKGTIIGLISGLSISLISFVSALFMFFICFFVFDVRLHWWVGHPYVDTVIYYNYMSIIFGFFISAGVVRYMSKSYTKSLFRSTCVISSICSVIFIITSWFIIKLYFNLEQYLPPIEGLYFLVGYGLNFITFVFLGLYLFLTQIVLGAFVQYKNKGVSY